LDQGCGNIRKLILSITFGILSGAAIAASPALVLQSFWWTDSGAEVAAATTQPSSCLSFDQREADLLKAGLAIFNTPSLLGGQAAKAGLSCNSCHDNGRNNPHFRVEGLSSESGTADVTSSFFSILRSNKAYDPVEIPDLANLGKVSRAPDDPALERLIRTLIVEEFAGKEPSDTTLKALATYVRAIRKCDGNPSQERRLKDQLHLIDAAIDGALAMHQNDDDEAAKLLVRGARHQLGLIDERYSASGFGIERQLLLDASRRLQDAADTQSGTGFSASLKSWHADFKSGLAQRLATKEHQSLYNPKSWKSR
jgi:hypothetical protein